MTRILIEPGYTVEPRFIDLDEHEELCALCHGTGQVVHIYAQWHNVYGPCWECGGDGKRLRCTACGELQRHKRLRHKGQAWMDDLCLKDIVKDPRFAALEALP